MLLGKTSIILALLIPCLSILLYNYLYNHIVDTTTKNNYILNKHVKSALQRVKTIECAQEIKQFIQNYEIKRINSVRQKRTCPFDSTSLKQFVPVGCIKLPDENGQLTFVGRKSTKISCLNSCFSYGFSYATYGYSSVIKNRKKGVDCYCFDQYSKPSINVLNSNQKDADKCDERNLFTVIRVDNGIYNNLTIVKTSDMLDHGSTHDNSHMKIAFLLSINGRAVDQIYRLLNIIYSPENLYIIHVDKRNDFMYNSVIYLQSKYDNVIVVKDRFRTIWGGTALLKMILETIVKLTTKSYEWDYLINLSESDFPVKNMVDLKHLLKLNRDMIFLRFNTLNKYSFIRKQGLEYSFYQCDDRLWRVGKRALPSGLKFSGGSDWFVLPRNFCQFISEHYRHFQNQSLISSSTKNISPTRSFVGNLIEYFNHTLLPAESFFHTVAQNSEYCGKVANSNLRFTNWKPSLSVVRNYSKLKNQSSSRKGICLHDDVVDWCGSSPLAFRFSDLDKILSFIRSKKVKEAQSLRSQETMHKLIFFGRKFDPTISHKIIDEVEFMLKNERVVNSRLLLEQDTFSYSLYNQSSDSADFNMVDNQIKKVDRFWFNLFDIEKDFNLYNQDKNKGILHRNLQFLSLANTIIEYIVDKSTLLDSTAIMIVRSTLDKLNFQNKYNLLNLEHIVKCKNIDKPMTKTLPESAAFELDSIDLLFKNDQLLVTLVTFECIVCKFNFENDTLKVDEDTLVNERDFDRNLVRLRNQNFRFQISIAKIDKQLLTLGTKYCIKPRQIEMTKNEACYILIDIEVGHGFDENEKLFRDFNVMHQKSRLVAKTVWQKSDLNAKESCSNKTILGASNHYDELYFRWLSPKEVQVDRRMNITTRERTKIELNLINEEQQSEVQKVIINYYKNEFTLPIQSGEWLVQIIDTNGNVLHSHEFFVFPSTSSSICDYVAASHKKFKQADSFNDNKYNKQFNKQYKSNSESSILKKFSRYYEVLNACILTSAYSNTLSQHNNSHVADDTIHCRNTDWSSKSTLRKQLFAF